MTCSIAKKLATNSLSQMALKPLENLTKLDGFTCAYARQISSSERCTQETDRNQKGRIPSDYISPDVAWNVRAALDHACHSGLAPDRHLTIDWAKAGVSDGIKATGQLLKLIRDCLAKHASPIAYVWVREVGAIYGEHVHILLHVTIEQHDRVKRLMSGWMKRCGAKCVARVWRTRMIAGIIRHKGEGVIDPFLYHTNLITLRNYVLKHCHPTVGTALKLTPAGPCNLIGKRVSVSQNLSAKSRSQCPICATLKDVHYKAAQESEG